MEGMKIGIDYVGITTPFYTLPDPLHTGFAYTLERYKSYFEKYLL